MSAHMAIMFSCSPAHPKRSNSKGFPLPAESKYLLVVLIEKRSIHKTNSCIPDNKRCIHLQRMARFVHTFSLKGIWLSSLSCGKCWSSQHHGNQCLRDGVITGEELAQPWDRCSGETLSSYLSSDLSEGQGRALQSEPGWGLFSKGWHSGKKQELDS